MRVLLDGSPLVDGRGAAGIGRYVRSIARELRRLEGLDLVLSMPGRQAPSERHPLRYLHGHPAIWSAAVRCRPDLVHATAGEPVLGWPLSRQVVTIHDVIPWTSATFRAGRLTPLYFAVQRRRLQRCRGIIAISDAVAGDAVAVVGVAHERVFVVPHGVDAVFSHEAKPDDQRRRIRLVGDAGGYVLWIGSLRAPDPRKGLDVLIAALRLAREGGLTLPLVAAGHDGHGSTELAAMAETAGVPLVRTGFVSDEDLAVLLRGASVAVVPSRHEGFGLPALEAMAAGAPLVATATGSLPLVAGEAALTVAPGDAAALARALLEAVDPVVARRLRTLGPAQASGYRWPDAARATLDVYRRLAGRS